MGLNKATLENLKKNPHYKISAKQLAEAEREEAEMITFGKLRKHSTGLPLHPTAPVKKGT